MQTRFKQNSIPTQLKTDFEKLVKSILIELRQEVQNDIVLEKLLLGHKQLERVDTRLRRKPEDVTKEIIINKMLAFLGFSRLGGSSGSASADDSKEVDYNLEVRGDRILVEAEPLNKQLFNKKGQGVEQLKSYLERKSFRSNLGIATNGFEWVLIKYDTKTYTLKQVEHVDLRSFFSLSRGQGLIVENDGILDRFYYSFSSEHILSVSEEFSRILEEAKKSITKRFYEDYIKYVFGFDKKKESQLKCLLNSLETPQQTDETSKRLFVITLMSRLIFIKFLEDKKLVKQRLLRSLFNQKKENQIPSTFYQAYLQPLFYDVLNTPIINRKSSILAISEFSTIPYLNGGLFREVVKNERQYDMDDDILGAILGVLETYNFTLEDNPKALNPDILGLVFEKTINYLTGEGNDRRRALGAYYTPDDVTTYISKGVIQNRVLNIAKEYLKSIKWKKSDVDEYKTLGDFLENLPNNPKTIKAIYERISNISVLDPACGSGHFLTSVMKELYSIRKQVAAIANIPFHNYYVKKEIITTNLFGVDIESSAVEIARLRLWLSLIEDLDIRSNEGNPEIETLPNIEYNIFEGNGLLGYIESPIDEQKELTDENTTSKKIFLEVDGLMKSYRTNTDPNKTYELKRSIDERLKFLNDTLNKTLAALLASEGKGSNSPESIAKAKPFHWRLQFHEVLSINGGFDIVIGNPPYVETNKVLKDYPIMPFETQDCGNIYAHFIENGLRMLKERGRIGMIVPMSAFCTQRMEKLMTLLERNCSEMRVSHFGWRPSKLFDNVNRALSILLAEKHTQSEKCIINTTTYMKWYTEPNDERPALFKKIKYHELSRKYEDFIIPKIGTKMEETILAKVYKLKDRRLGNFISDSKTKHFIYYRTTGGLYWKIITDFQPKFYKDGTRTESSRENHLFFLNEEYKQLALAIYNSNFFWWFYTINSNGRDLNPYDLKSLPVDLDEIPTETKNALKKNVKELMEDLDNNPEYAFRSHKNATPVKFQKISPRKSKHLIDNLDTSLAKVYGFTETETDFLIHYDEKFRMGTHDDEEEDEE